MSYESAVKSTAAESSRAAAGESVRESAMSHHCAAIPEAGNEAMPIAGIDVDRRAPHQER